MANIVVTYWGCWAQAERAVAIAMADASASMAPFVPVAAIDSIFITYSPGWYETRRTAWENNWHVSRSTIEIGEEEVEVFNANRPWMSAVYAARLLGDCQQGDPLCLQLDFYNVP